MNCYKGIKYMVYSIFFFLSRGLQDVFDLWARPWFYFGVSVKGINKIHRPLQLYRDPRAHYQIFVVYPNSQSRAPRNM